MAEKLKKLSALIIAVGLIMVGVSYFGAKYNDLASKDAADDGELLGNELPSFLFQRTLPVKHRSYAFSASVRFGQSLPYHIEKNLGNA